MSCLFGNALLSHNSNACRPLSHIDMDHIVYGTKGGGWHHRPGGINQSNGYKVLKVLEKPKSPDSPYRLLVQAPGGRPKNSTFWPNSWSTEKVRSVINETYIEQVAMKGLGKGKHVVNSKYGFKIKLRIVSDGKGGLVVTTAFPNIK
uniref:EndoU domain-containing protein n=1 Tax=Gallaecimonas sp. GXIMD4217 TaxID=3131927 RepID=UPI004049BA7E